MLLQDYKGFIIWLWNFLQGLNLFSDLPATRIYIRDIHLLP